MIVVKSLVLMALMRPYDAVDAFAPSRPVGNSMRTKAATTTTATKGGFHGSIFSLFMSTKAPETTHDFYYKVLGLSRNAGMAEIRKAFRTMAKQYHPDSNPTNMNTKDMFQQVNRAYEVLRNPHLRRNYDLYGHDGLGTSYSSDTEEVEYHQSTYQDFVGNNHAETSSSSPSPISFFSCDQNQPRQPFRGGCFVDVTESHDSMNISARSASDSCFGRPNGDRSTDPMSLEDLQKNIGMGATSHSFFQDIDSNGRPGGVRDIKSTPRENLADDFFASSRGVPSDDFFGKSRTSFPKSGIFEVTDESTISPQSIPSDQTKSRFPCRDPKLDIQPGPSFSSSKNSEAFFAGKFATPNRSANFKVDTESPFVGDWTPPAQRQVGNTAGTRVQSSETGGDIQVELNVDSTTATHGGKENMPVTRLRKCDACYGNGCAKCGGYGLKRVTEMITVSIPSGSKDGSMIRLTGEGHESSNDGPSFGDLFVYLRSNGDNSSQPPEKRTKQDTIQVEIPMDLNAEEQALLDKLQSMLRHREQQQQQQQNGMRP